jgi:hypothetical protein
MKHSSCIPLALLACAAALSCAGGYKLISLGDLEYKTCWLSKPSAGIAVFASKQPLYETGNMQAYDASVKQKTGVFAVRIENKGALPLRIDSSHIFVLDGSGNPVAVVKNVQEASKAFGAGQAFGYDVAANPLWGRTLEPGKTYDAFICVSTTEDPYFATYYLRFVGNSGETLTEARF